MCTLDFDERCEVWSEKPVLARKPHHCSNCGATIVIGEAYLTHFDIFDGHPTRASLCYPCWLAREQFAEDEAHANYTPHPSSVSEMIQECADQSYGWKEALRWRRLHRLIARTRAAREALERARAG